MNQSTKEFISNQPFIGQLLSLIPDHIFSEAAKTTNTDEKFRKMTSKIHFITLFYAVLTKNSSLREVCKNLALVGQKFIKYGLAFLPCRSTLSDANANRDPAYFEQIYKLTYQHYCTTLNHTQFSLPIGGQVKASDIEVFDSTTITLFKEIFKGTGKKPINGKRKGGIKAFTKMNLAEGVPNFVCFDAACKNETSFLKTLQLKEGAIAVFDKGFNKYQFYDKLSQELKFYVTRLKCNAKYSVVKVNKVTETHMGILKDEMIEVKYKEKGVCRTLTQRLITFQDPISSKQFEFITNIEEYKASTIALIYKNRWVIEVLFKQMKQNFELTYFLSDSPNGIKSQIWMALILNLLFSILHRVIKQAEDFSTMVQVVAKNLCCYMNIIKFFTQTTQYCQDWYKEEIRKVQLELFKT